MKILFFDCETTGKPLAYGKSYSDLDNWPRVTQLAWSIADTEAVVTKSRSVLIYPDGWEIPEEEFFIKNNMSTERCMQEGLPLLDILDEFIADKHTCDILVGHNLTSFDHPVVWAEILRQGRQPRSGMHKICTMKESTAYCKIPYPSGRKGNKWPTLGELHRKLFGCDFDGAHDAGADIAATMKCFFELVRLGVITLPTLEPQSQDPAPAEGAISTHS